MSKRSSGKHLKILQIVSILLIKQQLSVLNQLSKEQQNCKRQLLMALKKDTLLSSIIF